MKLVGPELIEDPWEAWQERAPHGPWFVDIGKPPMHIEIGFMPDGTPDRTHAVFFAGSKRVAEAAANVLAAFADRIEKCQCTHRQTDAWRTLRQALIAQGWKIEE